MMGLAMSKGDCIKSIGRCKPLMLREVGIGDDDVDWRINDKNDIKKTINILVATTRGYKCTS